MASFIELQHLVVQICRPLALIFSSARLRVEWPFYSRLEQPSKLHSTETGNPIAAERRQRLWNT
jgi:hypothetical protein